VRPKPSRGRLATGFYTRAPVSRGPAKRALFFLHVPKTAGATLTGILSNRFATRDCLHLYDGPAPDLSELERFRYVSGHLSADFLDKFENPPFAFTFVRDPIERALSSYSSARSQPLKSDPPFLMYGRGPEAYERIRDYSRLAQTCSIEEIIDRAPEIATEYFGNRQARALCASSPEGGDERLEDAIQALERFDFVGVTERMDESATLLARRLGWTEFTPVPRANVTATRLRRDQVSPSAMDALLELNSIDRELYPYALSLYEHRVAEWSADSNAGDPSAEVDDAPPVSDLRFGEAIQGAGWIGRERTGDGPYFCWIGHTASARVDLAGDGTADRVVVEIAHAVDPAILQTLRITVDGNAVQHTLMESDGAVLASAPLKRRFRRRGRVLRVNLKLDHAARPRDVDLSNPDNRELGIAVRRVALLPT